MSCTIPNNLEKIPRLTFVKTYGVDNSVPLGDASPFNRALAGRKIVPVCHKMSMNPLRRRYGPLPICTHKHLPSRSNKACYDRPTDTTGSANYKNLHRCKGAIRSVC